MPLTRIELILSVPETDVLSVKLQRPRHFPVEVVRPGRIELPSEDPQSSVLSVKLWAPKRVFYLTL